MAAWLRCVASTRLIVLLACALTAALEAEQSLELPSMLIVRSLAPWQEPLYPELVANDRWFCASARTFRCRHRTWLTLPPGREEFHPWFSRFYLASHALATETEHADVVLWLDADALFFRHAEEVEADLFAWLPIELALQPLLLASATDAYDPVHAPKAFFVANVSAAREVLVALSELLPREDRPLVPGASRGLHPALLHGYAFDGEVRAQTFGCQGQLELLQRRPALAKRVSKGHPGRVVTQVGGGLSCALPFGSAWAAALEQRHSEIGPEQRGDAAAAAGLAPPPESRRPFIVHIPCGGEEPREVGRLARLLASHNRLLSVPLPTPHELALGGSLVAEMEAAEAGRALAEPALAPVPSLLLIVYGEEYARSRTPVFVRSLLAARTVPLRAYVLADPPGLAAFREVLRVHAFETGLGLPADSWSLFTPDASTFLSGLLAQLHSSCHTGGYAYLFFKLLAHAFLPAVDRLLVLDSDAIVLGDVSQLWATFQTFGAGAFVGMAPDMSHRYYYRLSDRADEVFSTGWQHVPQRTGLNGGLMVLHLARMRAANFSEIVIAATHRGARLRDAGHLSGFCALAEQDTVNWLIGLLPHIWQPISCAWNYMGTQVGGHTLSTLQVSAGPGGAPLDVFYDTCPSGGPLGANGQPGDLLRCGCGRRVEILHFAGGTRGFSLRAELNASIVSGAPALLRQNAQARRALPPLLDLLRRADDGGLLQQAQPQHDTERPAAAAGAPEAPSAMDAARARERAEAAPAAAHICADDERCPDPCVHDDSCPDPYSDV